MIRLHFKLHWWLNVDICAKHNLFENCFLFIDNLETIAKFSNKPLNKLVYPKWNRHDWMWFHLCTEHKSHFSSLMSTPRCPVHWWSDQKPKNEVILVRWSVKAENPSVFLIHCSYIYRKYQILCFARNVEVGWMKHRLGHGIRMNETLSEIKIERSNQLSCFSFPNTYSISMIFAWAKYEIQ